MKRKIFLIGALSLSAYGFAQVGVNTETPKSTFDVTAKKDGAGVPIVTDVAGLQAPRLTLAQLAAKGNSMYGADQVGAIIYITDASGGGNTLQRVNITTTGYYYFDNATNVWVKIGTATATGDTTDDAFVNDTANAMVKLGTKANGTARSVGTEFIVKDNGQVLIGTDTPFIGSSKMEIENDAATNIFIRNYNPVNGLVGPAFIFQNSGGTKAAPANLTNGYRIFNISGQARANGNFVNSSRITSVYKGDGTTSAADIRFATKSSSTGNDSDMILDENGNVGIGTANNAGQALQVHREGSATNAYTQITNGQTGSAATDGLLLGVEGTTGRAIINNQELSTISFINAGTERMTILQNGNIGIGTTTPTGAKLHVESAASGGALRIVDTTQGAGKVLTSDASGNASWQTPASGGGTYTASNGLTITTNDVKLGGSLAANTTITGGANTLTFSTTASGGNKFVSDGTSGAPKSAIQIQDGSQGAGKILTSDANGNATWVTPTDRLLNVTPEITASYSLAATDDVVLFNNSSPIDFTLPTSGVSVGRKIYASSINTGVTNYKPDGVIRNASYNTLPAGSSVILIFIGGGKWEAVTGY